MLKVTPILGHIAVVGGELVEAKPASNNTRWIFDVEGQPDGTVVVQLLDPRSRKPFKPDIVSCSFLPLSASFYEVRPFLSRLKEEEPGTFALKHPGESTSGIGGAVATAVPPCAYRVQVDIMHSATR